MRRTAILALAVGALTASAASVPREEVGLRAAAAGQLAERTTAATRCAWTRVAHPSGARGSTITLNDLAFATRSSGWAVGTEWPANYDAPTRAFALRWDGRHWTRPSLVGANVSLEAVATLRSGDAWAVGSNGYSGAPLAFRWNGRRWSSAKPPDARAPHASLPTLGAVYASGQEVWAAGSFIAHWSGGRWSVVRRFGADRPKILDLDGTSSKDIWAVGLMAGPAFRHRDLLHWDGFRWERIDTPRTAFPGAVVESVAAISAKEVWIAGSSNFGGYSDPGDANARRFKHFLMRWNGARWVDYPTVAARVAGGLLGVIRVVGRDRKSVWAAGSNAFAHWNGRAWTILSAPNAPIIGRAPNGPLWAVGPATESGGAPAASMVRRSCRR